MIDFMCFTFVAPLMERISRLVVADYYQDKDESMADKL
jgi:hypothetical protein